MKGKTIKKWRAYFLVIVLCIFSRLSATIIATSEESTNQLQTFNNPVNNKVYDRATGTIYLSTKTDTTSTEESTLRLVKAIRPIGNEKPKFTNITPTNQNHDIDLLALATEPCFMTPYLAFVESSESGTDNQQKVYIVKNDGTNRNSSQILKDAAGNDITDIINIAANKSFIFSAVVPHRSSLFGEKNSGIAVICINPTTLELKQTAAAGGTIIKAKELDLTTNQIKINNNVTFTTKTAALFWDHYLQRLYIGLQLDTGKNMNDGAKAVVVADISSDGVLTLNNIAPDNAFQTNIDNIVGIKNPNSTLGVPVSIKHVNVMHCSTGPSYLIVNGGTQSKFAANNTIYALPLVDTNPLDPYHGTLANKASTLQNNKFVDPAITNNDLPESSESPALVGMGDLPIQSNTEISDIVVTGDTIYVSINKVPDETNDSGIFYSHALFDEDGKIIRWTPWTKRALPLNAFPNLCNSEGKIAFFDVDALTGKLWAVEGTEKKAVCSTAWDQGATCQSLPKQLNNIFNHAPCNKGCFSVLDLDQSTRGFYDELDDIITTTHRYTLFGGADKVVFARISESYTTALNSPQEVIDDFTLPENLLTTKLEPGAGCVHVLEYSRTPTNTIDNNGYFFAGTENGLFAFADDKKNGFYVDELKELNQQPFLDGQWYYINQISGSVIDIKTIGNRLYVIMLETSFQNPIKSKLYGIDFDNNLELMFDSTSIKLLAESGEDELNNAHLFTGISILATGSHLTPLEKEQVILATNNGLFRSCADQDNANGMMDAKNQSDANWQPIPFNNTTPYWNIISPDTPIPSTTWSISIEDKSGNEIFQHSSIQQLSLTSTTCCNSLIDTCNFIPFNFNAISNMTEFQTLDPITHFWSDGARRFFVIKRPQDPYCLTRLLGLPYNTSEWCIINPRQYVIFDPIVWDTKQFNWIHQIGASGILMVGTNSGVIALE